MQTAIANKERENVARIENVKSQAIFAVSRPCKRFPGAILILSDSRRLQLDWQGQSPQSRCKTPGHADKESKWLPRQACRSEWHPGPGHRQAIEIRSTIRRTAHLWQAHQWVCNDCEDQKGHSRYYTTFQGREAGHTRKSMARRWRGRGRRRGPPRWT